MKPNQYLLKIASNNVQAAFDDMNNPSKYSMECDAWIDDMQTFTSWLCMKYAGKKVVIIVQVQK